MEFAIPALDGLGPLQRIIARFASEADLLSIFDAAKRLGVSEAVVRSMITRGQIDAVRFGRSFKIDPSSVARHLSNQIKDAR